MLDYDEWCKQHGRNSVLLPGSDENIRNMQDYIDYVQDIIHGTLQDAEGRMKCSNVAVTYDAETGTTTTTTKTGAS
tara:strand:- start:995 stop:1222 length:228 start_codon:yes stop_codon:yes gene_type:complete